MRPTKTNQLSELIASISPLGISEVGSPRWFEQQVAIETLHQESLMSVRDGDEDVVWEMLTDSDKIPVLVFQMLMLEKWNKEVLPKLVEEVELAGEPGLKIRFVIQFESTLADLVSMVVYHKDACASLGSASVDLAKWCRRQAGALLAIGFDESPTPQPTRTTPDPDLTQSHLQHALRTSLHALSILRSLLEFSSDLPLEFLAYIVERDSDIPTTLIQLLESTPWLKFTSVIPEEMSANMVDTAAKLTRYEAQVWMSLASILSDPDVRSRYEIDAQRRDAIMQIREMLSPVVLKHLPHLRQLIAISEQVSLMEPGDEIKGARSKRLIREVGMGEGMGMGEMLGRGGETGRWFGETDMGFAEYVERLVDAVVPVE